MARVELADLTSCPCGCGGISLKGLTKRGHVPGCGTPRSGADRPCYACQGRRNRAKGQRGQADTWRALGGEGRTPQDEESTPSQTVTVRPESKKGKQVPRELVNFLESEWFRRAMEQAQRGTRIGAGVKPSVACWPSGGGGYLIVELRRR